MQTERFKIIEKSLHISAPSWPLQNTVAVNPFWFLRHKPFHQVMAELASTLNTTLYMPLSYYKDALNSGAMNREALQESININTKIFPKTFLSIEDFMSAAETITKPYFINKTLSQLYSQKKDIHTQVMIDFGKYASAYLDEKQAISVFPWNSVSFWEGWPQAQKIDRSMEYYGFKNFKKSLDCLNGISAEDGIYLMLEKLGILGEEAKTTYMQSLLASVLGWSSQFKYVEWQKQLGYVVSSKASSVDLLAVRMAYDYGVCTCLDDKQFELKVLWAKNLNESPTVKDDSNYLQILHFALELSYQKNLVQQFNQNPSHAEIPPKAQILFCIDVRSEMIRRNIEETNSAIKTIGFAGFFGIPFDYKSNSESIPSHRLPVLLNPAFMVEEAPKNSHDVGDFSLALKQVAGYFRNLRKNPLSSFLYVELFGALYIEKSMRRSFLNVAKKIKGRRIPHRFSPRGLGPSQSKVTNSDGTSFTINQKIERAEAVLRHMGLCESFAKLVLIIGHGSVTTNNAFGSSLDCGACGGHAGDINARFLADLLNDSVIRKGLETKGISIPSSTQFIAGVHETVSDQIYIIESDKVSPQLREELSSLMQDLNIASVKTRNERFSSKPYGIDPNAEVRSKNWSEVRPEWGLAGNACFIVAPRSRTLGKNLNSRSFLHDYDWKLDEEQGYKTLELIMTAPMIVTNWINLQYFASTVAPAVFGSGNKVLHNLVNETGVYEGNGGDLRVGLPFQSVHDGNKFVHEPLRLSVFIEAPRDQIELIIANHEVVRQLVDHEWLHLIHIEPEQVNLTSQRRTHGGVYVPI
ncbi:MAG: DUF2309 domain-containing protein [Bacteriovorax sp.]|nr:DUF2309 domain-containing protein [Bacteriovorax sp.]